MCQTILESCGTDLENDLVIQVHDNLLRICKQRRQGALGRRSFGEFRLVVYMQQWAAERNKCIVGY